MHSGEEWFLWSWQQYAMICVLLVSYILLSFANKLPSMDSFKKFADTINSSGGHILILFSLTLYSIKITMQLFYHVMGLSDDVLTKAQAIVSMGMSFCTGTLVGLPLGALLKTMTGGANIPTDSGIPAPAPAAPPSEPLG